MNRLEWLNNLPKDEAQAALRRCCGSTRWAREVTARRPFADREALFAAASGVWGRLDREDWLEAFSHHPKIGDVERLRERFAATATWSEGEQAGVSGADEEVLEGLAEGNRAYEERFGWIFLVCATGKPAAEMLALLRARLPNEPEAELRIAAGEQDKITRLRLDKLLQEESA
jgi:2-oxo-4-hydroxy-4-carboxy-5-ureidoimidazoline decarboxylase